MDEQFNEKEIFDVARRIDSADARIAYLTQVCGDNHSLFDRITALVRIHDQQRGFLATAASGMAPTLDVAPIAEEPGTKIGRYKLVHEIGHGGMGVVYMAVQKEPVKRKVALKIIKPGMDTREVVTRFEAERQALALMDHQSIAKVLDGGSTESGRPYFVMELVEGTRSPSTATSATITRDSGWSCSARSAGPSSTPTRKASFTGTSSRPIFWSPMTTTSPCQR